MECIRIGASHRQPVQWKVRMKTPDGKVQVHSDIPVGAVFWSDGETHEVENIGGTNVRILLIELKGARA
jgi:hypothetical protein